MVREAMRWLSQRGAAKGGKARWEGVSPAEQTAHAKKAVAAREGEAEEEAVKLHAATSLRLQAGTQQRSRPCRLRCVSLAPTSRLPAPVVGSSRASSCRCPAGAPYSFFNAPTAPAASHATAQLSLASDRFSGPAVTVAAVVQGGSVAAVAAGEWAWGVAALEVEPSCQPSRF